MLSSPNQYDPDSREVRVERAVERLKITKNAHASVVCFNVICDLGNRPIVKKYARISLAAEKGYYNLLNREFERR